MFATKHMSVAVIDGVGCQCIGIERIEMWRTNLCVYELCQSADELWRSIYVGGKAFFVDVFPDGVPEGGFEALGGNIRMCVPRSCEIVGYVPLPVRLMHHWRPLLRCNCKSSRYRDVLVTRRDMEVVGPR